MSGTAVLERRYRHWLGLFPADHRAVHGEEMLGVLMAGARTGQQRPRLADCADLAWGALKIRLRHSPAGPWRDALAVISTVLPLIVLPLITLVTVAARRWGGLTGPPLPPDLTGQSLALWAPLGALVILRLRRTAALAALAMLTWMVLVYSVGSSPPIVEPPSALTMLLLVLEAVALAASPGPRRGLQLLRVRHYGFAVTVAAASGLAVPLMTSIGAIQITELVTAGVMVASMAIASPLSRRIVALLSLPLCYWALSFAVLPSWIPFLGGPPSGWEGPLRADLAWVPVAVLWCTALAAALRPRGRRTQTS